jgi:hypothetical protein
MNELTCERARELMLEAEVEELEGHGDSPLVRHIERCASCRVRARHLLQGYADLDAGLAALAPRKRALRFGRRARWLPLPLAAAAVLALLLARRPEAPVQPSELLLSMMFPEPPVVTPPPGRQAMVLEKNDLTVVWLY